MSMLISVSPALAGKMAALLQIEGIDLSLSVPAVPFFRAFREDRRCMDKSR
jgi:hypothetical protein